MEDRDIWHGEAVCILARTIYGEARGQPRAGKEAVASVILNRVKSRKRWGSNVTAVCLWPIQFSCWNHNDPNRKIMLRRTNVGDEEFNECLDIAEQAVDGNLKDNTKGSTHYANLAVCDPFWARGKKPAVKIGDHTFWNNIG